MSTKQQRRTAAHWVRHRLGIVSEAGRLTRDEIIRELARRRVPRGKIAAYLGMSVNGVCWVCKRDRVWLPFATRPPGRRPAVVRPASVRYDLRWHDLRR